MIEENFNSMVIMKCDNGFIRNILNKKDEIHNLFIGSRNYIYKNFEIWSSYKREFKSVTISWEEEDKSAININNFELDSLIDTEIKKNKVCRIDIWKVIDNDELAFVFFQNTSLTKSSEVLGKLNFQRVILHNSFFEKVFEFKPKVSIIGKSISIGYNINKRNEYFHNEYSSKEQITEVKFIINLERRINVKINNKGIVKIFNKPNLEEAYEIIKLLNSIFSYNYLQEALYYVL